MLREVLRARKQVANLGAQAAQFRLFSALPAAEQQVYLLRANTSLHTSQNCSSQGPTSSTGTSGTLRARVQLCTPGAQPSVRSRWGKRYFWAGCGGRGGCRSAFFTRPPS